LEDKRAIAIHLCKNGFVPGYEVWTFHSESGTRFVAEDEHDYDVGDVDRMDEMLKAVQGKITEDPPTAEVILLAFITRLMAIMSKVFLLQ
jgi:hypothetical protein